MLIDILASIFGAKKDECDGDCLGCSRFEVSCDGDEFTEWLLYEDDEDEY